MKTYLFNLLTQSFKEKNLIFEATKGGEAAKTEAPKDAAPAKPEEAKGAEKKPETPEEKKAKIKEAIGALTPKFEKVLAEGSGYTEDFIKETKKIKEKFEEITKKLEGDKKLDKADLKIFNEKLEKSYENKSLERNKSIQAQRVALEAAKTDPELTADKIWEAQKSMLIEGDFSESILEAIKEKFNAEGRLKNQFEFVSKILDGAEKGASDENADKNLAEATKEIKNLTKGIFTTKDFTAQYNAVLEEVKKINDFPKDVKTLGEKASAAKTAIFDKIAEDIKKSKEGKPLNPNSFVAYQQEIMYAHVADVLGDEELTPEKIKSAISLYDLGKFKPGKESAEAKKTLDKLLSPEIKDKLIAAGIRIDFMGGTDGTDHQLMKSKEWHDEKVTAFDKLVAFDSAGHLNPPLTADNKTEIEAYKTAVAAGTQADFLNDAAHKDKFLSGGMLFDQALALQRAEDKAERVKESFDPAQRYLNIELGNSTAADNEEKKSGIAFNIEEKPEVDETKPQYEVEGGTVVVTLPKDPQKPNDVPVKLTYTLSTVPSLQAELKPGNPPTITVEGRVATLELEGEKLVSKDKDPNDEDKKFTAYCTLTIVEPKGDKQGTIEVKKIEEKKDETPQDKEHPNDSEAEATDRKYYEEKKVPYKTEAEAKAEGMLETTTDNKLKPKDGYDWAATDEDNKAHPTNYATKRKEVAKPPEPAADLPDTATPDGAGAQPAADLPGTATAAEGGAQPATALPDGSTQVDAPATPTETTDKVPEAPVKDYTYLFINDGKDLQVERGGEKWQFKLNNQAEVSLSAIDSGDNNYVRLDKKIDGKQFSAYFEFDPKTGVFNSRPIDGFPDLHDTTTISYDKNTRTINVIPKNTPADAPVDNPQPATDTSEANNSESNNPASERRTLSNGIITEGLFDKETGRFLKGKATFKDGDIYEGLFDKETGRFLKGKCIHKSGEILEGDFDKDTGNLIKGKATSKSGEILEGDFDKDTRAFIKGKRTFPDGRVVDFPEPKLPLTISGNTLTLNMNDGTTKKYTIKTNDNTKLEIKEKKSGELCEVVINGFVSALIDIKPKLTPPVSVYMGYGEPWQFNIKTGSSDSIKEIIFSPRAISDANIIEELLNQNDWIAKSNDGFSYYNKFARNRLADNSYEYWMVPNGANDYRKLNKE